MIHIASYTFGRYTSPAWESLFIPNVLLHDSHFISADSKDVNSVILSHKYITIQPPDPGTFSVSHFSWSIQHATNPGGLP